VVGLKILIDILTPKQCMLFMLFSKLSDELEKRGHEVQRTTRKYREVIELLQYKGMKATVVGEHGGRDLSNKLRSSAKRIIDLAIVAENVNPDIMVSFSSPELARVSYGLGIPHVCVNDSPHAEAVAKLTIPLSERLLTPKIIPKRAWTRFGITPEKIVTYDALDPWAWLRDFVPDQEGLKHLGLDSSKTVVVFRPEESHAAYLLGKIPEKFSIMTTIARLSDTRDDIQIVALARYEEQLNSLKKISGDKIEVPSHVLDGPSLLSQTSLFVGAGGTMSAEAALMGVPTLSCYPGEPSIVEKYLIRKKLLVRVTDPEKLLNRIIKMLGEIKDFRDIWSMRAKGLVETFEDPIKIIADEIEKFD